MGGATIQTWWSSDEQATIELSGAIEGEHLDTLRDTLVAVLVRRRPARVLIDLTGTTRIDPIALGALDAAGDAAADLGIALTVRNRRAPVQRTRSTAEGPGQPVLSGRAGSPAGACRPA